MSKIIFKKQLFWMVSLVFISISLVALTVVADPMDDFIAEMEAYKADVENNYPSVIHSQFLYMLDRYFSFAAIDHQAVTVGLAEQAKTDLIRIQNIKLQYQNLRNELSNSPLKIDEFSAKFFALMSEARFLQKRSEVIEKDIQLLATSWLSYCNDNRITNLQQFFDPLANFTPNGNIGFLSGPTIPYSVGVQIGMNENGDVTDFKTQVDDRSGDQKEKEEAATTATAAGVASFCGPWWPVCFIGVFALKSLIDLGRMGEKLAEIAKKEQKQYELRRQIYDIQYNAIVTTSKQSSTETLSACRNNFKADRIWPNNFFKNYRDVMDTVTNDISSYVHVDLIEARQEYYDFLLNQYFPQVTESYLSTVRGYFADQQVLKSYIMQFTKQNTMVDLKKWQTETSTIKKTLQQQQVWNDIILSDSLFREDDNFSFYNEQGNSNSLPNIWHNLGPKILQQVAQ
jgi:hypothetical protein